jgi:hypothetical protein
MRKWILYFALLTSPFLFMVVVNEANRTDDNTIHVNKKEEPAINTEEASPDKCTWNCHNNGCLPSHRDQNVISLGPIDTLRRMIIESLGVSNGDTYQTNNVLFLVILWPVLMFGLVVANVELFIRNRKKNA